MHRDGLGSRNNFQRTGAEPGQLPFHGVLLADENYFDAEISGRAPGSLNDDSGSPVSAHRVNGDFRHGECLALLGWDNGAPTIKTAVSAGAVRQHGFAAIGTGAPLRLGDGIVGTALIFHSFRSPSLRNRHRFDPVFPCFKTAAVNSEFPI
jgi:hypothetical protein